MILDHLIHSRSKVKAEHLHGEKIQRSLVKSISWRVIGTVDTVLISWWLTGALTLALSIGGIELISKMILYFFHERAWNKIKWGK